MTNLNLIGLNEETSAQLAEKLNKLLAEYSIFYMNVRGFHWNITGDQFFELHVKFEELYTSLAEKIDEMAERILTLGKQPVHSYSQYIEMSSIREKKNISDGNEAVKEILNSMQNLIISQRELLHVAAEAGDEGTADLMSDYMKEQEKLAWMYNAYLK